MKPIVIMSEDSIYEELKKQFNGDKAQMSIEARRIFMRGYRAEKRRLWPKFGTVEDESRMKLPTSEAVPFNFGKQI